MVRLDATTALLRPPSTGLDVTDPWGHRLSAAAAAQRGGRDRGLRRAAWLVPAVVMAVLGAIGVARPGLWTDELATWGMTQASWPQMWSVLRWVDAVLAPYYVLMWGWSQVAGDSDLALRLPSLAAMSAAAGLVGALGARLAGPRVGLLSGLVFAALPSSTRFGQEARPYALTAFAAALATYLLVLAWARPTLARLSAYAAAIALLGLMHVIALLLLAAHLWVTVAWHRESLTRLALAATAGVLPLLPLVWLGSQQSNQVSYIPPVGLDSADPYGAVVFGGASVAVLVGLLSLFALPLRRPAAMYTAWVVLPTAALVLVSLWFSLFLPRYLIFTVPGWALLAGTTLARVRGPVAVVGLACVAALGLSAHVQVRGTDGHDEATRDAARIVAAGFRPGDAIVYAGNEPRGGWTTRDLVRHYVPEDRRPDDPLMVRPPRTGGQLLAGECPDVARCLGAPKRIWVIRLAELDDPLTGLGAAKEHVLRGEYRTQQVWRLRNLTVALVADRSVNRP